jgi:hypothetical protein
MGWARYRNHEGRECGYAVAATCDHPGCTARIDRGLGYLCGTTDAIDGSGLREVLLFGAPPGHPQAEDRGVRTAVRGVQG